MKPRDDDNQARHVTCVHALASACARRPTRLQRPVLVVGRHPLHEAEHLEPAHDAAKHRVLVVEVRGGLVEDEKLAACVCV
jgi:hypothetical protein